MSELTLFPEDARKEIGVEKPYGDPIEVVKGAILRYAEAILDQNPLHVDEGYAKSKGFSGLVAPPLFLCGVPPAEIRPPIPEHLTVVHGGDEWELFLPVVAGDVITRRGKLLDITERAGRTGRMVFITTETDFINQRGEQVARYRATSIVRPKPGAR